jgi:hypothetical protein
MSRNKKKCVHANDPKRGPYPFKHSGELVDYKFKDEAARKRSLFRHSWYRRTIQENDQ